MQLIPTPPFSEVKLLETKKFELGHYPFTHFNYLQTLAYEHCFQDNNLIVSAATSAGKTVIAELIISDTIKKGAKAIYLSPLKALTSEKIDSWTAESHFFSSKKLEILTGDYVLNEARLKKIKQADLVLMTSEMLDTRTRYINSDNSSWIKDVDLVVVDEAHLISTKRGPALEVGLMRFTQINPNARIVLLSATMTNHNHMGQWIKLLNNKETKVLATPWRPVDLNIHTVEGDTEDMALSIVETITRNKKYLAEDALSNHSAIRNAAECRMKGGEDNTKTLVFVHTKNMGRKLEELFQSHGIKAQFHNADLDKGARQKLEGKFKKDLDVLISTSTLAWGLNLPARFCVVVGDMRGYEKVEAMDIAQMAGRAGRFGMYDRGDVFLINCSVPTQFEVHSTLHNSLPFHIVAEISNKTFNTQEKAVEWFERSFHLNSHLRKENEAKDSIAICFQNLIDWQCIALIEGEYQITSLGRIARDLYLDPQDVYMWKTNFALIEKDSLWKNNGALAWALCSNIKTWNLSYVPAPLKDWAKKYLNSLLGTSSLPIKKEANKNAGMACTMFYRLQKPNMNSYEAAHLEVATALTFQMIIKDIGRVFSALGKLNALLKWDREDELEVLKQRIIHGVGEHLLELVSIPGIGGTIATQLYTAGIKSKSDLLKNKDKLSNYITRKANVTRILNGLKELEATPAEEDIDFTVF
jgi:replicative superfamily II helicase